MNKFANRLNDYIVEKNSLGYMVYSCFHKELFSSFDKYIKGRLLDVGCGNKPYLNYLKTLVNEYVGCDIEQSSLEVTDIICPATDLSIESNTFDSIISTQVLEHVSEPEKMINECYRVLRSDGYFVLSTHLIWPIHGEPYDFYRFTKYGLIHLLEKTGFEIIECKPCGGKWAMIGQMLLLASIRNVDNNKCYVKRLPNKIINRLLMAFCNNLFPLLDRKFMDEHFTMNYVIVGKK